jgi:hypothetical protein
MSDKSGYEHPLVHVNRVDRSEPFCPCHNDPWALCPKWEQWGVTPEQRAEAERKADRALATTAKPSPIALVKVTVNLLPDAYKAIETAAEREGISRTDAINRALQVYETLTGLEPEQLLGYEADTMHLVVYR